jgi:hypothetical protein
LKANGRRGKVQEAQALPAVAGKREISTCGKLNPTWLFVVASGHDDIDKDATNSESKMKMQS